MLQLSTKDTTLWDEQNERFIDVKAARVQLEHSLISISKWESIYEKPFPGLNNKPIEGDEFIKYIKCMIITPNADPNLCYLLASTAANQIEKYMNRKMTATFFGESKPDKVTKKRIITSELVYYWMIAANIPFECDRWHINRLFTLINVCGEENKTGKKSDMKDVYARNRMLNELNRKRFNSKG